MAYRNKLSKGASRRNFARGSGTHKRNLGTTPFRGGIRL